MKFRIKGVIFPILFLGIIFLGAKNVLAVNTGTVGLLPAYPDPNINYSSSWFIYKLDLGQSKNDAVRVINNREETTVVKIYAVDATVTSDGAFALLPEDAEKKDVGGWVKMGLNEVEVPPKSEKLVPFTITIPKNADAGDHAGGIVMQETEGTEGQKLSGTGVKIITRVGVRIYETVPGEVKKDFAIKRLDWRMEPKGKSNVFLRFLALDKKSLFFFGIENKGSVSISPKAKVEITNIFGRKTGETPEGEVGVVFPRTETKDSMIAWDGMPFFGRYRAKLIVNFAEEGLGQGTKEIVFWVFPYRLMVLLVLLFVLLVLSRLIFQYFREAKKENMPIYKVGEGETLGALASRFKTKWKKLAVINDLKKPFEVSSGQELFIPVNRENFDYLKEMFRKKEIGLPLKRQAGGKRKSRSKMLAILFFVAIVAAGFYAIYYFKFKKEKDSSLQNVQQQGDQEKNDPQESSGKTKAGVTKKSSIGVRIFTPEGTDSQSSKRLQEKLILAGYKTEMSLENPSSKYEKTTIEYASGAEEKAKLVKADIGVSGEIELFEKADLNVDTAVYNKIDKNEFLEIGEAEKKVSSARELIKVKLVRSGADDEKMNSIKDLIFKGDFGIQEGFEETNSQLKIITIVYLREEDRNNAEILKNFLAEKGEIVISEKAESAKYPFLEDGMLAVIIAK